jgi:hypothetical protein
VGGPLLEGFLGVGVDLSFAQGPRCFGQKEIDATEQSIELVPRLANRFADFECQRARERLVHVSDALSKRANRVQAFFYG